MPSLEKYTKTLLPRLFRPRHLAEARTLMAHLQHPLLRAQAEKEKQTRWVEAEGIGMSTESPRA